MHIACMACNGAKYAAMCILFLEALTMLPVHAMVSLVSQLNVSFATVSRLYSCATMGFAPSHLKLQSHDQYLLHLLLVLPYHTRYAETHQEQNVLETK